MNVKLIKYNEVDEKEYLSYIIEWEEAKEKIVPYASRKDGLNFNEKMEQWMNDETDLAFEKGFVPSTQYFLVNSDNKVIGAIHFRHELNESLRKHGGHIGYGIRPKERKKGYATKMLHLMLEELKIQAYEKVMISCDDINAASAKTIEKNNGVLEDKIMFEGNITRRYWVNLK